MSLNTAMPNFVAGEVVTEEQLDALAQALDGIQAVWDPFTPTISGWTLGNGVLACAAMRIGKTIHFRVKITAGTTTTTAGTLTIAGLPVTPHADCFQSLRWVARDASAGANYYGDAALGPAGALNLYLTAPFTWAANDYIGLAGTYEGA